MLENNSTTLLYRAHNFTQLITSNHQINQNGELNQHILKTIKNFAKDNETILFNLSEQVPIVRHYCYLKDDEFTKFWIEQLTVCDLKPQRHIHPLDLLKAFYWFSATEEIFLAYETQESFPTVFFTYANQAVRYGSHLAGCLLLNAYLKPTNAHLLSENSHELETQLKHLAELNLAPGYWLLTKYYYHCGFYQECLTSAQHALNLLPDSTVEMHNAVCDIEEMTESLHDFQICAAQKLNDSHQVSFATSPSGG